MPFDALCVSFRALLGSGGPRTAGPGRPGAAAGARRAGRGDAAEANERSARAVRGPAAAR